jgi:TorA maturation chaperone TorD
MKRKRAGAGTARDPATDPATGPAADAATDSAREQAEFRRGYYGLLVRVFSAEPQAELLAGLKSGLHERIAASEGLNPSLADGWRQVAGALASLTAEQGAETYTRLFIGPFQVQVQLYESHYLAGTLLGEPLVAVRQSLRRIGLAPAGKSPEPEDWLPFELDVMNWLIGKQIKAHGQAAQRRSADQVDFLRAHLLVWAPQCARDIEQADPDGFYGGMGKVLRGFLELEREFLAPHGLGKVETLEEARARTQRRKAWKGPTFDPGTPTTE